MSDATVATLVAVAGILASLVAALLGSAWLNRKNLARLTDAQADNAEANTTDITDRIAREWLERLEKSLDETKKDLEHEKSVRRGAINYIERLLRWIKLNHENPESLKSLPVVPNELNQFLN